jgi:ATP-dependent helicase/nuclease subunit A
MSGASRPRAPDWQDREAAIRERARNVLIDAGAGTGKTTILVERLVELVAPADDEQEAMAIDRLAAVTFTRKAAGELRLRIRERLLAELAAEGASPRKRERLRVALGGLDMAAIGTIHAFADRLLRLRPMEAGISPQYEIAEDIDPLVAETCEVLVHGAERGGLEEILREAPAEVRARALEAEETVRLYLDVGLRARERLAAYVTYPGLDSLCAGFIEHRDQPPRDPQLRAPDLETFRRVARRFIDEVARLTGESEGLKWLRDRATTLETLLDNEDPTSVFAEVRFRIRRPPDFKLGEHFQRDKAGWAVWKAVAAGDEKAGEASLIDQLLAPFEAWLAARLVRLFPVIVALYEQAKARHQLVDQTDLLLKLRDLLRDDAEARAGYQKLFDHLLVDEFQDTDPLQAEILVLLCMVPQTPSGVSWTEAILRPGVLTIVGDPKQSIYRFRRADISTYDQAQGTVARQPHLRARLAANFRSRPRLIEFVNERFDRILGVAPAPDRLFDESTGVVFHQPLLAGRGGEEADRGLVHLLPLVSADPKGTGVDDYRALEGKALARYLRWLVEKSGLQITDPRDHGKRTIGYGDVAVLAFSTLTLKFLFRAFDEMGVPYSSRGGVLFLSDELHKQFLLGLRALSDRRDGVAQAALMRPPFFAIDPTDVLRARLEDDTSDSAGRGRDAEELIADLRKRRFERSPGETARDLLEHTAFARQVALGPNGPQRLARLRELCLQVDRIASEEGLDFDAVTSRVRSWISSPVHLDPPHPVASDAVQVLTVHQAKGLEWPVVVLWDACALMDDRERPLVWRTSPDGAGWVVRLDGFKWEHPAGGNLGARELQFQNAERRRLAYVAATRARDLLVVTTAEAKSGGFISAALLANATPALVEKLAAFSADGKAEWARDLNPPVSVSLEENENTAEEEIADSWRAAVAESGRPLFQPRGISAEAHARPAVTPTSDDEPTIRRVPRVSRFGALFGETVHRAIGLVLRGEVADASAAVSRITAITQLAEHGDEAVADVKRALDALAGIGIRAAPDPGVKIEYPIAAPSTGGILLSGYLDLVHASDEAITIIDFKTDAPPSDEVRASYPEYFEQVRAYARILAGASAGKSMRAGLLFTGNGQLIWT